MKTMKLTLAAMTILMATVMTGIAQTKGSGNVTTQDRQVAAFDAIEVGCAIHLMVSQGDIQSVKVETDDNLQERLVTKVANGTLELSCENMKSPTKMNVYVTAAKLAKIEASGASVVKSETTLKSDVFDLTSSDAAKVNLNLETGIFNTEISGASENVINLIGETINSEISGAGNLTLTGTAGTHNTEVSGAGILKALEFITDNTDAEVSGVGNAKIMARKELKADLSGAGTITYFDKNTLKKIAHTGEYQLNFEGMENVKSVIIEEKDDKNAEHNLDINTDDENVSVILDDKKIVVITDDSVRVRVGDRDIEFDDDGVKMKKGHKKPKFDGHWQGFELGVNGLLKVDNTLDMPDGYKNMELNYRKSTGVNINLLEQNFNLCRQHLGLVTGLGLSWNNYRFDDNVVLSTVNDNLKAEKDATKDYEKSKLVVSYLTVPLMLEYQTNSKAKANSFHIGGGVVGGLRIGSHTKVVYNDGGRQKDKERDDFYLAPFKVDAIAKIGWGKINLFGTYALTELFRENKGPQVYPFAIGICLTDL